MDLAGKTALVFAAGGAVGSAVARRLAACGARVFASARSEQSLRAVQRDDGTGVQEARGRLSERYATSCALVSQQGVCFQCVELDEFFNGTKTNPLDGTPRDIDARLAVLREHRSAPLGPWHRKMMVLVDEILED